MRNKLALTALAVSLMGGVALADHDRDRGRGEHDRGERHERYERGHETRTYVEPRREYREYHPDRHVYVNNNRFAFSGGVYRDYRRPVIRERYRDYRVRPRMIVESYDPVQGYVWMPGAWQWNGAEWQWFGGHYVVEGAY